MVEERDSAQTTLCDEEKFKDFSDVDTEDNGPASYRSPSRPYRTIFIIISALITAALLLYFSVSWWTTSRPKYDQCGTTPDEARARGCVFETTGFTWITPECADPEIETEFLEYIRKHELKYFRDLNYTQEVSIEEAQLGNGEGLFVREEYHLTHCLFLLKKLHHMRQEGKSIDGQILPLHHTAHCVEQNLAAHADHTYREKEIQFSYIKYPFCGRPGGFNVQWGKMYGKWTYD